MYNMIKKKLKMEKKKVYFPCYGGCEFHSLEEAVNYVEKIPGKLSTYISEIVMYNIRFRDCLRAQGIDGLINMLIGEAPAIIHDTKALEHLNEKWVEKMGKHIADYDIQCLPKDYWFLIEDCWFEGINDIDAQIEMYGSVKWHEIKCYAHQGCKSNPAGLHIGHLQENFPIFDSFDASDDRKYNNYVFSRQPLTEEKMEQYFKTVSSHMDFCMVHEEIPKEFLPILYYNGDSDYVLLATEKRSVGLDFFKL